MKNRIKYIIVFFTTVISIFGAIDTTNATGDLHITVDLKPVRKVKSYKVNDKMVLDTGIYNSQDTIGTQREIIAKVDVIIEARKKASETGTDYCLIDGEFNGELEYERLKEAVESTVIELKTKNYNNKSKNVKMRLEGKNYKEGKVIKDIQDQGDKTYLFSPYPYNNGNGCTFNTIQRLEYSFDLILDISGIENGSIIGGTVEIEGDTGKGAVKDLVTEQIFKIMTKI